MTTTAQGKRLRAKIVKRLRHRQQPIWGLSSLRQAYSIWHERMLMRKVVEALFMPPYLLRNTGNTNYAYAVMNDRAWP